MVDNETAGELKLEKICCVLRIKISATDLNIRQVLLRKQEYTDWKILIVQCFFFMFLLLLMCSRSITELSIMLVCIQLLNPLTRRTRLLQNGAAAIVDIKRFLS